MNFIWCALHVCRCVCLHVLVDEVIKGWEIGVPTMARGEIAVLRCTPSYAYHETGLPPAVPPNAILVFEVEMIDFKGKLCIMYYSFDFYHQHYNRA